MEKRYESSFNDSVQPVSIKETEFIIEQMKTCVCKIHLGSKKGTGFFIKIPFRNQSMNVLMTNHHVLSANEIIDGKIITISFNNEEIIKNIKIDSNRKRYTNEKLDITIIEILGKDNINNYLTLDQQIKDRINLGKDDISINTNYISNMYANQSIYLLNYIINNNISEEIFVSYGLLDKIDIIEIQHKCNTGKGSSGSPILLLKTKTVIGIHYGGSSSFNLGLFLLYPLTEFQNISNNFTVIKLNLGNNSSLAVSDFNNNLINQKVDKIYNDTKNYFFNERNVKNILNNKFNQRKIYHCFLVDEKWVDKWKKYSNYEYIKTHYFESNINDEKMIKQVIHQNLVNNNLNYDEINDIEKYIIKDINQLKLPENKNKSYFLLDVNFLRAFPIRLKITSIPFYLSYQNIQIYSQNILIISSQTNINKIKNIIIKNEYHSECLKHLIKFVYLKLELKKPTDKPKKNLSEAYIINSKVINKLKKEYDFYNLILGLRKIIVFDDITYLNFDENYHKISEYINENLINYIDLIKKIEKQKNIRFTEDEISLKPKYLGNKIELKYFDGFELIDIKFATFLKQKFNIITMPLVIFGKINNMLLAIIEQQPQNIFEIVSLDYENNLIVEYLIEIVKNNLFKDKISLNNFIYNVFLKDEIKYLYNKVNPISLENNNFVFNLYSIDAFKSNLIQNAKIEFNNLYNYKNGHFNDESSISSYNIPLLPRPTENNFIITFETTYQAKIDIQIKGDTMIKDLIKLFFERIKRPDLYGDKSIKFIYNGNAWPHDSKELVKSYIKKKFENYIVIIDDNDEKLVNDLN